MSILVEACVDSVQGAIVAEHSGAGRLELCANLVEGGTTPSGGMMRAVLRCVGIPVFAIVRPRGGDFLYDAAEIEVMLRDIEFAKTCDIHGIVSGALNPNGTIDEDGTSALIEAAHPLPFTFHRAFDATRDLDESLDALQALGVHRVLTSGGAATATDGTEMIARLVRRGGSRITVMAGGGVRHANAAGIVKATRVRELHLRGSRRADGRMAYRTARVHIARPFVPDDYAWDITDGSEIGAVVQAVERAVVPAGGAG
ncbi:MAG: copper homeostasis protein CutC [Gemmatimonadaceae bacterium]|nr:copper homeostasis protein CutC [Gemmatimonadaceae bacterium]